MTYIFLLLIFIIIYSISFYLLEQYCRKKYSLYESKDVEDQEIENKEIENYDGGKIAFVKITYENTNEIFDNVSSLADFYININDITKLKTDNNTLNDNVIVYKKGSMLI